MGRIDVEVLDFRRRVVAVTWVVGLVVALIVGSLDGRRVNVGGVGYGFAPANTTALRDLPAEPRIEAGPAPQPYETDADAPETHVHEIVTDARRSAMPSLARP